MRLIANIAARSLQMQRQSPSLSDQRLLPDMTRNRALAHLPAHPTFSFLDAIGYSLAAFVPDEMESAASVCTTWNYMVNSERLRIWNVLKKNPMLRHIIEEAPPIQNAVTIKAKMNALADILYSIRTNPRREDRNPHDDPRRFVALLDGDTYGALWTLAQRRGHTQQASQMELELVSRGRIDSMLSIWAKKGNLKDFRPLLPLATSEELPDLLRRAMKYEKNEMVDLILKTRLFRVDKALIHAADNDDDEEESTLWRFIPMILSSGNPYWRDYNEHGGMNEGHNRERGLQRALTTAIGHTNMGALNELLKARPSIKMLEHMRDLAVYNILYCEAREKFGERDAGYHYRFMISRNLRPREREEWDPAKLEIWDKVPPRFQDHDMLATYIGGDGDRQAILQRLEEELKIRSDEDAPVVAPLAPGEVRIEPVEDEPGAPAAAGEGVQIELVEEAAPVGAQIEGLQLADEVIPQEALIENIADNRPPLVLPAPDHDAIPLALQPIDEAQARNQFIAGMLLSLLVFLLLHYASE